jgi:cytochrome c6
MNLRTVLATVVGVSFFSPVLVQANSDEKAKSLFVQGAAPPCAICHTYSAAGSNGMVGPNLDDLQPTAQAVRLAVTNGVGVMPAYGETLSSEEIEAIVQFVSKK